MFRIPRPYRRPISPGQAGTAELGSTAPLETYVLQRLASTGCIPVFAGTAFANGLDIPDHEIYDPAVMAAENAVNFMIGWDNDLISYAKEKFHGEVGTNVPDLVSTGRS
ncbi:terpene synthase family protein [Streptomyces sp. NPDC059564]|uniref:terpene synthase family protein n=1 Tax=Streptomyces sp. NPDC059564 TaxID=3346865 RepID=UPI0036C51951